MMLSSSRQFAYSLARHLLLTLCVMPALTMVLSASASADESSQDDAQAEEFFETKIRPVLVEHCYECHSADSDPLQAGLLLDSREGLLRGGDSGPALVAGNPDESLLLRALRYEDFEMPPTGKLPPEVIENFAQWISKGAWDPRKATGELPAAAKVEPQSAQDHWAFVTPVRPQQPPVLDTQWSQTPIDDFILAKLESEGLKPVEDADRATLLRRAHMALIGLPPTPEELQDFLADPAPDAFDKVIDRLLSSPHYGERWGRHWLDLARYADTNGADENHSFPNAWRYRDYVIQSLNADKPYDQFLTEQLAGDLLPVPADERKAGELLTATGLLVVGPKMLAEQDKQKMIVDIVDEQIDAVSRTFLGLTVACARCHDHKFDPIPTEDYYALAGIFTSTRTMADQAFVSKWMERDLPNAELAAQRVPFEEKIAAAEAELKAFESTKPDPEELKKRQEALEALKKEMPAFDAAMAVEEGQAQDVPVHIRGNHLNLAQTKTPRGMLQITEQVLPAPEIPSSSSGRLELAQWLTDPRHPLTARVMVNRIWLGLFGEGLVRSPSNFGLRGERPTHPELLDWLAVEFVESGWSVKHVQRLILTSRVWQLSSVGSEDALARDPDNRWLSHQNRRRLEAEPLRDSLLAVAHSLDRRFGGPPPDRRGDIDSPRRAVYLPINRSALYEMFAIFDYNDASSHVAQRATTTVPHQALYLLNNPLVLKQAESLARQLLTAPDQDDAQRIESAYIRLFARLPTPSERDAALQYIERLAAQLPAQDSAADNEVPAGEVTVPTPVAADAPAPLPGNVPANVEAAWVSLCRVLLATNEFIYVN